MILLCTVLFQQLPSISMGVVPGLMGSVYLLYVMDSPKRQEDAMNTGRQSLSSFRQVSWFILRADRDTGPMQRTVDGSLVLSQVV